MLEADLVWPQTYDTLCMLISKLFPALNNVLSNLTHFANKGCLPRSLPAKIQKLATLEDGMDNSPSKGKEETISELNLPPNFQIIANLLNSNLHPPIPQ